VATHTWADLYIEEAADLADLAGIDWDLRSAQNFAELLQEQFANDRTNWRLVEPLSIAATVMYSRPFLGGVRRRLIDKDLEILTASQRKAHDHLRAYRDKHVAHSVSGLEENIPRADYCVERVNEEGITAISYGGGRVAGLSSGDLENVVELCGVFRRYVGGLIKQEEQRLLPIVRAMPLERVLAGGQKAFVVDTRTAVHEARKK
jgi:hypothetical protein